MSDTFRTALRGVGQTLMTLGVVVLLFCVYELYVTGLVTAREQTRLGDDLRQVWAEPAPRPTGTPAPGQPGRMPYWHGDAPGRAHRRVAGAATGGLDPHDQA